MRFVRLSAFVLGCLALALPSLAEEKSSNKEKIVGTWEIVKTESEVPPGTTLEFTKDGKITMKIKDADKTIIVPGTYEIDGDKLKTSLKFESKELKEAMTIKTLTESKLVTVDEKGRTDEFKKK